MSKTWQTRVEEDPETGDLIVTLPEELMAELNWQIGDKIQWEETLVCEETGEFKGAVLSRPPQ